MDDGASELDASDRRPYQVQAVWCVPDARGGVPTIEVWPPKEEVEERYLLTNAPDLVFPIFAGTDFPDWHIVDIAELHRLLFPAASAVTLEEMLPPAGPDVSPCHRLWNLWQTCHARLDALPVWALENISIICREREEEGLAALFARQSVEADMGESRGWAASFPSTVTHVEHNPLPSLADCTALDPDEVASHLDRDGALARLIPDYEPRPGQLMMLKAVVEAFNEGKHLVVEAGTGIGKSLAYLLPAAMWAQLNDVPVIVSTKTKNLQTQLVEKDLPAVLSLLASGHDLSGQQPLKAAVIKGRSNYLCLRRLGHLIDEAQFELSRPELRLFAQTIAWATTSPDGDLDVLLGGASIDPAFVPLITSSSDECLGRGCKYYRRCFVQKARLRALKSKLVVANHALVFTELDSENPVSLPPSGQIIFDEAHNLEEAATRFFTKEFSSSRLARIQKRLFHGRGRSQRGVLANLRKRLDSGALGADPEIKGFLYQAIDAARNEIGQLQRVGGDLFHVLHALLGKEDAPTRYRGEEIGSVTADPEILSKEESEDEFSQLLSDILNEGSDQGKGKATPEENFSIEALKGNGKTRELASSLEELEKRFREPNSAIVPCADRRWQKVREVFAKFRRETADLSQALEGISGLLKLDSQDELALSTADTTEIDNSIKALDELYDDAMMILAGDTPDYVFWVEHVRGGAAMAKVCAAPLNVGPFLCKHLFEKRESVVLCSATLRVGGHYKYISSRLGLDKIDPERLTFCNAPSPFDYLTQCSLLVPSYLPEPISQDRSYVTELSDLVCRLARKFDGRTLVLFTSYEMLRQCAKLIGPVLEADGIQLLRQGESGSRNLITRVFRKGQRTVLFGTQSFWEGVDVVGSALSCVVVARLPFVSPTDTIFSARCEQLEAEGKSSFGILSLPAAVLRLRQGFGRLIRHRNDRGCVVIADTRVLTKRYGKTFLRSLPTSAKICGDSKALLVDCTAPWENSHDS